MDLTHGWMGALSRCEIRCERAPVVPVSILINIIAADHNVKV
jgi:hypothetical protein